MGKASDFGSDTAGSNPAGAATKGGLSMGYEFKIGDRIVALGDIDGQDMTGRTGTIVCVDNGRGYKYGIQFDEHIHGHDCNGHGEFGYCRYSAPGDELMPMDTEMDTEINTEQSKELDAFILSYEVK